VRVTVPVLHPISLVTKRMTCSVRVGSLPTIASNLPEKFPAYISQQHASSVSQSPTICFTIPSSLPDLALSSGALPIGQICWPGFRICLGSRLLRIRRGAVHRRDGDQDFRARKHHLVDSGCQVAPQVVPFSQHVSDENLCPASLGSLPGVAGQPTSSNGRERGGGMQEQQWTEEHDRKQVRPCAICAAGPLTWAPFRFRPH